jgi:hypothetical protein
MQQFRILFSALVTWSRRPGVHLFLFCGFLIFLCWPILSIAESMEPYWSVVIYLFGLWAVMIAVVFFVAMGCLKPDMDAPKAMKGPTAEC